MKFLEKIAEIEENFKNDHKLEDHAKLYGVHLSPPLLAKHMIFLPMPDDLRQQLVENYKKQFPEELLTLYSRMNGAALFWTTIYLSRANISIPIERFSIYGVPLTHDRNHLEPFNISLEDCNRPYGTPGEWLKFGSYEPDDPPCIRTDLFIDTETKTVYGVKHQEVVEAERREPLVLLKTWDSLDLCLCALFDALNTK